jgi:tRNA(His) 5'-end guanylyltransferase
MSDKEDVLGDRLKAVEQAEAGRKADFQKPLMARLDGRAFHTFTRGLPRPFDKRLSDLMCDTTAHLIENFHAKLGYTQSDEITLFWQPMQPLEASSYPFDGKFQKLTSVLAGSASAFFSRHLPARIPEKGNSLAVFDCRVWTVEDMREVYLNYLWRQDDAIKNSISMAAQAYFSHKQLHGVGSEAKKQMLREIGIPWEDQPRFFKMGTFLQRVVRDVVLTQEQLERIPEKHRPSGPVPRSFIEDIGMDYIKDDPVAKEIFA